MFTLNKYCVQYLPSFICTYLPIDVSKNFAFSLFLERKVRDMLVQVSGRALFKILWRRPCGAISITNAFLGMCLQPSSNNTGLNKLLVRYWGEQNFANGLLQSFSAIDVLIHFEDRSLGFGITYTTKITKSSYVWQK